MVRVSVRNAVGGTSIRYRGQLSSFFCFVIKAVNCGLTSIFSLSDAPQLL